MSVGRQIKSNTTYQGLFLSVQNPFSEHSLVLPPVSAVEVIEHVESVLCVCVCVCVCVYVSVWVCETCIVLKGPRVCLIGARATDLMETCLPGTRQYISSDATQVRLVKLVY